MRDSEEEMGNTLPPFQRYVITNSKDMTSTPTPQSTMGSNDSMTHQWNLAQFNISETKSIDASKIANNYKPYRRSEPIYVDRPLWSYGAWRDIFCMKKMFFELICIFEIIE